MIKIYHYTNTRGLRPIWVCEELNLKYKLKIIDFSTQYRFSSDFLRISPIGKVPVMQDGDTTMCESGAMVHYVITKYGNGKLMPEINDPLHMKYLEWSWFAEATFASSISEIIRHKRAFPNTHNKNVISEFKKRANACLEALNVFLGGKEWLLGEKFSGADIMMGIALTAYTKHVEEPFPDSVALYLGRLTARPAFLRTKKAEAQL